MDSNGNQRKRAGRVPKNINADGKSPVQNIEHNEDMEVSAVAISPILEECVSANNVPASECRRSSRKKIIKFDVRDLLNKNRKTHKIQIEARIDSNAPTTSKASTAGCIEAANSKLSSTTSKEDLLSKHKTFLEKSAIFRRYSVSQEHKAPPPPLPIPPLLAKSNDKDSGFSGTSSCQEFLSHALIKPKQPTSLIVAQIESNKPSSVATAKRKNIYKSIDQGINNITSYETPPVIVQKKRGRPAKNKTQSFVTTPAKEESVKRKLSPEKAKNWKEYKACLAQQSSSIKEIKHIECLTVEHKKEENQNLVKKQDNVKDFDDTLQSDISRSDDDGNFSGFQTSKDDVSCDSPLLEKLLDTSINETLIHPKSVQNINSEAKIVLMDAELYSPAQMAKKFISKEVVGDDEEITREKNVTHETEHNRDLNLDILKAAPILPENLLMVEPKAANETKILEENQNKNSNVDKNGPDSDKTFPKLRFKRSSINPANCEQRKEVETKIDINISREGTKPIKEKNDQYKTSAKGDKSQCAQKSCTTSLETDIINSNNSKQKAEDIGNDLSEEKIPDTATNYKKVESIKTEKIRNELQKTILETDNIFAKLENVKGKNTTFVQETSRVLKSSEIVSKTLINVDCIPNTKNLFISQISTSSDETKSFSRTSSSSESENASEKSYFSSESFSTTSSSSPRSYKSGDKLKVSIKRVPLPKSPSTSSQTSASEEFNNADVLKSKPPIAKRSKRLQNKFKEALEDVGPAENIENSFKQIRNDSNISETEIDCAFSKVHIKESDTSDLVYNVGNESITKHSESRTLCERTASLSDKSSNIEHFEAIKRKSFRNLKNYSDADEKLDQKETDLENKWNLSSDQGDNYNDQTQNITEMQSSQSSQKQFEKPSQIEQSEETKMLDENESFDDDKKHKLTILNREIIVEQANACDDETEKALEVALSTVLTNEEDSTTKVLNVETEIQTDLRDIRKAPISNEIKAGNIDKPNSAVSILTNQELAIKDTSNENKTNKEDIYIKESTSHPETQNEKEIFTKDHKLQHCSKNKSDKNNKSISEEESVLRTRDITKSPKENMLQIVSTINKTNKERKDVENEVNEKNCVKHSTVEDKPLTEIIQVAVSESNVTKTSNKNLVAIGNETSGDNPVNFNEITCRNHKEVTCTRETGSLNENNASLKVICPKITEIKDMVPLTSGTDKSETFIITSTRNRTYKEEISIKGSMQKASVSKVGSTNLKEEPLTAENQVNATKISSTAKTNLNKGECSTESSKNLESNRKLDVDETQNSINLKNPETSTKILYNQKKVPEIIPSNKSKLNTEGRNSPLLCASLIKNKNKLTSELGPDGLTISAENSKPLQDINLADANIEMKQSAENTETTYVEPNSAKKISPKLSIPISTTKTVLIEHADSSKPSQELNFFDKLQETNKSTAVIIETFTANRQQENMLHDNNELNLVRPLMPKRRGRKPRFKNLHDREVDSETDTSTGKNTPIDEISNQKLTTETNPILKEIEKDKEMQSSKTFTEKDTNVCETEKTSEGINVREASVSTQENGQSNILSSQIKNVSIETNTLLDILRTVQSNTEAALKATKSPINIDRTNNEDAIKNTSEMELDESSKNSTDILKLERESDAISPILFSTESSLTTKNIILSPARSDSASPLSLKKLTPSPTRSNSASPLTLRKVTRRYERRSRPVEDSAHKTLEETFAEIAAQSSKAVLAAKEFDINEDQIKIEISQKDLGIAETVRNDKKEEEQIENFTGIINTSVLEEKPFETEGKDDESILKDSQDLGKVPVVASEVEITPIESVIGGENFKLSLPKRGRKPKNRTSDISMTGTTETLEINNSPKIKEDNTITKEVEKVDESQSETEIIANEKFDENKTTNINKSSEIVLIGDLSEDKSSNSTDLAQTNVEEDGVECKLNKKVKKRDTKIGLDDDTCEDKEGELRNPKQPVKKRDSSANKSESKSVGKKISKKPKSEDYDSLNNQKDATLTNTTPNTPPTSKRGRKPKNHQSESPQTSSKKKNKKDICNKTDKEGVKEEKDKLLDSDSDILNTSSEKSIDEKLAKKKRQRKLKEAFEAALTDDKEKSKEALQTEISSAIANPRFGETHCNNSPPSEKGQLILNENANENIKVTCMTPVETEEDLDPLKDIEKFIADGVNLLKKDYKLDEDSVDDVMPTTPSMTPIIVESIKGNCEDSKHTFNTFETPADTPIHTPSVTPPPKSPTSIESTTPDENSGVRRSHRIKLITKTPKALVGRGLVRDRERFSIKDDVETKSHYTMDDHLTDLAEVEAKNAKFLKEMEERLSNFQVIKENDYLCERVISREARKMICDCFLTHGEEERGELGCGEDCLNRLLMIECGPECNVKERCTNKRFQKLLCSPCRVFRTEKKGFGIMADIEILPGEFIMEYVGEVIDTEEFEKRRITYSQDKNRHYYFMALRSDAIIDATIKGNISRFINHSCDPNAETQKWTVNGELRIGFFSRKSIMPGEEITFNYQYQRYGREAQRCYCESSNCRGWIGQEPTSDEGEQMDDEDDESEDDEADTSNLLVQDDDEDSDASVTDPEEVQKQLEMAAARAEVDLAPLQLLEEKVKQVESTSDDVKSMQDPNKSSNEEDSKSKFKKLLSKMAEKVAAKQKQNKREQKLQRKKKSKASSSDLTNKLRFLEDPDIEDEVEFLKECGLKNQSDTLRLSRLMVRAKLLQTRLNLLEILRKGDFPCRRLFLDYHGMRLLHGWMSEDAGNMQIRLSLLQTLETLPIANKTVLTDSKVMQVVRNWCGSNMNLSPNEDSSSSNSNSQDTPVQGSTNIEEGSEMAELQKLALKLITTWESLPEIFRIPKKERIEQMKEHEREADRQYAANAETQENNTGTDRYRRDRFGRGLSATNNAPNNSNRFIKPNNGNPHKSSNTTPENIKNLSKAQRREMFAAKVARDEAEKRLAEERREFETKCRFFGLDPKKTRPQDIPFCVNPATGQWFSIERKPIPTPPSYAHVQVQVKPKSTDPNDYQLPAVCSTLPSQWKYAITSQGKIYYYHIKHRISQWEPPSASQLQQCDIENREEDSESEISNTAGDDSSDDDDDILIGMDPVQLKAYIDGKVEMRRQKRYHRLVDQRSISPRREEDRIYNQLEVRKYKENKEKIRKRKEDIRRKRTEALRQTSLNMCTLGSITDINPNTNKLNTENDGDVGSLPIQDYLLSSDEECDLKAEINSPLMDKIVEGDKIVDELDALTSKKQLKRPLPAHRDFNESSTSTSAPNIIVAKQEYKKRKLEKKEKRKPKEQDAKYRKNKEKFRCEIAGIIVHHLKPYLKETCSLGRIQSNEDFNHLARKLTHFVMIKELKYCESVGQTLVVTESVKSKSREFIKKYMAKYGDVYIKPANDPDFKDIPFTL